jgi:phosphate starvation-inducible PhoH-like protein
MPRKSRNFEDQVETRPRAPKRVRQKVENFDLLKVQPKTDGQRKMVKEFRDGKNLVAVGTAGTGKSLISSFLALEKLLTKQVEKIIIVRSAVNIRNQGFLPGSLEEKEMVYTIPYKCIFDQLCQSGTAWETLTKKGIIQFISTTYIRGLTLENCVVIVDEVQNCDSSECESLLTRLGENCQVIICGDTRQNDLFRKREVSCFDWLMTLMDKLSEYFTVVHFKKEDIVRSQICKAVITAIEDM